MKLLSSNLVKKFNKFNTMKLKKKSIKKFTFLKLYILKYNKHKKLKYFNNFVSKLEIKLKYLLRIIFEYNYYKKKILFLDFSKKKTIKTNKLFLPKTFVCNGLVSNKNNLNDSKLFNKLPELVVWFNFQKSDFNLLNEFLKLNIPVILFGYQLNTLKKNNKNIFKTGLNSSVTNLNFYRFLISIMLS